MIKFIVVYFADKYVSNIRSKYDNSFNKVGKMAKNIKNQYILFFSKLNK